MNRTLHLLALAAALALAPAAGATAPAWIERSYLGFDTAKQLPDSTALAGGLVEKRNAAPPAWASLALPAGVPVTALAVDGSDLYFVSGIDWRSGDVLVTPRDVALVGAGGSVTLVRSGAAAGIPAGTAIDALSVRDGEVLVSLSTAAALPNGNATRSDVLSWSDTGLSVAIDASTAGVPAAMDVVALDRTATGSLLVAFDVGGEVGGLRSMPGDILEYLPGDGTWRQARSREGLGFGCMPCDLQALTTHTSSTTIFRSGIEAFEEF